MRIFASRYDSTSMETSIKICKRTLLHDTTFTAVFLLFFTLCYDFLSQWNRDECVYCFCIYGTGKWMVPVLPLYWPERRTRLQRTDIRAQPSRPLRNWSPVRYNHPVTKRCLSIQYTVRWPIVCQQASVHMDGNQQVPVACQAHAPSSTTSNINAPLITPKHVHMLTHTSMVLSTYRWISILYASTHIHEWLN